jgi:hypothetical protein
MAIVINGSGTVSGLTAQASDVELTDSTKIMLGTDDDLQIYEYGGNSYIKNDTGSLIFRADAIRILNNANSEQILHTDADGAVTLYYDNGVKLATTSTGIDVTGTVTATGNVGIGTATGAGQITQRSGDQGTAGNVTYSWVGNTGTGLRRVANDTIAFDTGSVERLRIDSSGNVGIGVTPESWHSSVTGFQVGGNTTIQCLTSQQANSDTAYSHNSYYDGSWKYISTDEASQWEMRDGTHVFKVAASDSADAAITWTTAMTIDNSGNVGFGTTSVRNTSSSSPRGQYFNKGGSAEFAAYQEPAGYFNRLNTDGDILQFRRSGTTVGTVSVTTTATAYNTSSDYRLKENVVPMTGSIDRLKELNPSRFNFVADADKTVDGFLAHEAQEVVPEAITGTKDAMQTEEYTVSEALGEVFTPAVEEVTEERQVTETVETGSYVNLAGETITETQEVGVTEEATETVIERQDIDGVITEVEVERVTQEPVTETVVTTEAIAEVILETDVEKPEELTEGQWRETTAKVTAEREVPDMQGIDQGKLVPLLTGALQEAVAKIEELTTRIETLENA